MSSPQNEGALTSWRIAQLPQHPLPGVFDASHLLAHHAWIFDDLPHHRPGQIRPDAVAHIKARELELGGRYYVPYAPRLVLIRKLPLARRRVDVSAWHRLSAVDFSRRLATLYADRDYLHPFSEGNSRTLRSFTRALAHAAGFHLDWGPTNVDAAHRDELYRARDSAVIRRAFPGLDEKRAMATDTPLEYESWFVATVGGAPLAVVQRYVENQQDAAARWVIDQASRPPARGLTGGTYGRGGNSRGDSPATGRNPRPLGRGGGQHQSPVTHGTPTHRRSPFVERYARAFPFPGEVGRGSSGWRP